MNTNYSSVSSQVLDERNPNQNLRIPSRPSAILAVATAMVLIAGLANAGNILVNPSFEANSGHVVAAGWTYYSPPTPPGYFGDYWVESNVAAHLGTFYWKQWGALYDAAVTNVAGITQDFSSAPGSTYEAGGWLYARDSDLMGPDCFAWIEVSFLGASSNLLALYKSDLFTAAVGTNTWFDYPVTNACDLSSPVDIGDPYFTTYAITGSVSQLVAPLGTATVQYRLAFAQAGTQGGSCYYDDTVLDQISGPVPPVLSDLAPFDMIFVEPADGITFNVSSPSGFAIDDRDIHLVLNGADVSGDLVISGEASSKAVAYYGLESNQTYTVSITATDAFDLSVAANTYFETTWVGIEPVTYLWEAEDFDFANGMYLNDPELCNAIGNPNCYFGKVGVEGVDEHNLNAGGSHLYRPDDPMGTGPAGDYFRKNLFEAGRLDYKIDPFNSSEWVNYTRDWSASTNWVVARLATDVGLSGTLTLSRVNPDTSTTDLGTFTVTEGRGWSEFDNVYLKDGNGFLVNVVLNGTETLRVTSGGNLLPNCFMLVDALVDLPRLSDLYPTGQDLFEHTNRLSFTVATTGATFPPDGIMVNLDGVDVTANLDITGSDTNRNVVYDGLRPNAVHTVIITVTNSLDHGISLTNHFDTFSQTNTMVEAEDFDFDGGQFITNWFPEAYGFWEADYLAVTNVDYHHSPFQEEEFPYRYIGNGIPEDLTHDTLRDVFVNRGAFDYDLTWFGGGDWVNYTRDYPTGTFYVYGRFSGLGDYSMYLDQVVSGAGTTNQVTTRLGRWGTNGRGFSSYDWVPLTDDGLVAPVTVTLNGPSTLRITTAGNCNPNYFMLVPASGIRLSVARAGDHVEISLPTEPGQIHRMYYRDMLTEGNWGLLTTVAGDGTDQTVSDPATAAQRFYKAD